VLALCPISRSGGKIAAMNRLAFGLLGLVLLAGVSSCGASTSGTCGMGGVQPRPEIGGQVLFQCYAAGSVHGGLFVLDLASGHVTRLTRDNALNVDASWSPDGRRIVYQSTRDGRSDVYVMEVSSGRVSRLSDGEGFNGYPSWSPDGAWIAYESSRDGIEGTPDPPGFYREIYLVRADGSDLHRLLSTHAVQSGAAWSPTGDRLAFAMNSTGAIDIYTARPDGTELRQLTHHEKTGGFATYPRWSPDGSRILINAPPAGASGSEVYWIPAGGGEPHQVTNDPSASWEGWPDWSPDSRWIAFTRSKHGLQLFVTDPDGARLIQVTTDAGDKDQPRWRPA